MPTDNMDTIAEASAGTALSVFRGAGTIEVADLEGAPDGDAIAEILGPSGPGVMLTKPEPHDFDRDPLLVGQVTRAYLETYHDDDEGDSRAVELFVHGAKGLVLVRCPAYLAGAVLRAAGLNWSYMDPRQDGTFEGNDAYPDAVTWATAELDGVWRGRFCVIRYMGLGVAKNPKQSPPRLFELRAFELIKDVKAVDARLRERLRLRVADADGEL
jgi:hypothetical protein